MPPHTSSGSERGSRGGSSSTTGAKKNRLRVIIAGGSIAGLTLAHSLHHSDIDYVVLEARNEFAPQVGASIVVLPNGARILDQLGIFDDIYSYIEPCHNGISWTGDGKVIVDSNVPYLIGVRMGYPLAFLQRRDLLKVLSETAPDQSKLHTSKRVSSVDHTDSGVVVHCEDGSEYTGDIVVGADGIHSTIRTLMQKHMELSKPGSTKKDTTNNIFAEYNCIFGIGNPVEEPLKPGDCHRTYTSGLSTITFVGRGGILYFFLFSKLDKRYFDKDIPRYTKADMDEAAKTFYDLPMTDSIKFEELWKQRKFANMCCVEEARHDHWTSDRFVCLGDSVHKVTPNLGAGGNAAIESAAALANSLARIADPNPSLEGVRAALSQYYKKRNERADKVCKMANDLTRLEAMATIPDKIMALYGLSILGDYLGDVTCDAMVGAEILESLPPPARALRATMPWDPETGVGKHESKLVRALYALPLLFIYYAAGKTMAPSVNKALLPLVNAVQTGQLILGNGDIPSLVTRYFGVKGLDNMISVYVAFFTPSIGGFDPASRMQMIAFLADLVPIQAIWMIEGARRGNFGSAAHLVPTIMGVLYQLWGIGYVAPIYFFLHYVQSPLENYQAGDNRLTQSRPIKTIIPTLTLSYILPSIAMFAAPGLTTRQKINGLFWQPFPLYAAILQRVLSQFVKDTTHTDRTESPEADMKYLRRVYGFAGAAAALANMYVRFKSPVSLTEVFFKGVTDPSAPLPLIQGLAKFLRYDQICAFSAGAIWTLLSFRDLKKAGKLNAGWGRIVGVFAGTTIVAGPGAAMAAMWAWREEVLAKRKEILPQKEGAKKK